MELLGTVDWLLSQEKRAATVAAMREGLAQWPGGKSAAQRKQKLFTDAWLELALKRLTNPPSCAAIFKPWITHGQAPP